MRIPKHPSSTFIPNHPLLDDKHNNTTHQSKAVVKSNLKLKTNFKTNTITTSTNLTRPKNQFDSYNKLKESALQVLH